MGFQNQVLFILTSMHTVCQIPFYIKPLFCAYIFKIQYLKIVFFDMLSPYYGRLYELPRFRCNQLFNVGKTTVKQSNIDSIGI